MSMRRVSGITVFKSSLHDDATSVLRHRVPQVQTIPWPLFFKKGASHPSVRRTIIVLTPFPGPLMSRTIEASGPPSSTVTTLSLSRLLYTVLMFNSALFSLPLLLFKDSLDCLLSFPVVINSFPRVEYLEVFLPRCSVV